MKANKKWELKMDRRGFIGSLLALPLIAAGMSEASEKEPVGDLILNRTRLINKSKRVWGFIPGHINVSFKTREAAKVIRVREIPKDVFVDGQLMREGFDYYIRSPDIMNRLTAPPPRSKEEIEALRVEIDLSYMDPDYRVKTEPWDLEQIVANMKVVDIWFTFTLPTDTSVLLRCE